MNPKTDGTPPKHRDFMRIVHEVFFASNVAFAIAFTMSTFVRTRRLAGQSIIEDILLGIRGLVHGLFRLDQESLVGSEEVISVYFLLAGLALLIFLAVHLFAKTAAISVLLTWGGGVTALMALPGCWSFVLKMQSPESVEGITLWYVSILETTLICGFLFFVRRWSMPAWCGVLFLASHYGFWGWVIWPEFSRHFGPMGPVVALVSPFSGLVWAAYVRQFSREAKMKDPSERGTP